MDSPCKYGGSEPGFWEQDLGSFLPSEGGLVGVARLLSQIPVTVTKKEPILQPVCRRFDRCQGCPYPAHGFVCWGADEKCLRSEMEKIYARKERIT